MSQRSLLYDFLRPGEKKVLRFAAMPLANSMSLDIRSCAANTILSGHARWWGFTEQRNVQRFPEPTTRKGLDRVIP
jgi:hypothetical protein